MDSKHVFQDRYVFTSFDQSKLVLGGIVNNLLLVVIPVVMIMNVSCMVFYLVFKHYLLPKTYDDNVKLNNSEPCDEAIVPLFGVDGVIPEKYQSGLIVTKHVKEVKIPRLSHEDDVGYDLHSAESVTLYPGERKLISTGLSIKPPSGTFAKIEPKSGLSLSGIDVYAGIIDPGYTGIVKVIVENNTGRVYNVNLNQKIAQFILYKYETCNVGLISDNEFSYMKRTNNKSKRAENGFGSTSL